MSPCGSQNPSEGSNIECQFQHASFLPFDLGGFEIGSNRAPRKKKQSKEGLKNAGSDQHGIKMLCCIGSCTWPGKSRPGGEKKSQMLFR